MAHLFNLYVALLGTFLTRNWARGKRLLLSVVKTIANVGGPRFLARADSMRRLWNSRVQYSRGIVDKTIANSENQVTLVKSLQFDLTQQPNTLHLVRWTDPFVRLDPDSSTNTPVFRNTNSIVFQCFGIHTDNAKKELSSTFNGHAIHEQFSLPPPT